MSNVALRVGAAAIAMLLASEMAQSETIFRKSGSGTIIGLKRQSDFAKPKPARRRSLFSNWFTDTGYKNNDVDIIYGNETRRKYRDYEDPEPLPTLGLGNLDYVPPMDVALLDPRASKTLAATAQAEAVRALLLNKQSRLRTSEKQREAIASHYVATGFKPLWIENGHLNGRAQTLLAQLTRADEEGLLPEFYLPAPLSSYSPANDAASFSDTDAALLELGLTSAALTYARHVSSGQFEPGRLSLYHDVQPDVLNPAMVMRVLAYSPFPAEYLKSLAPKHAEYASLRGQLKVLMDELAASSYTPFEVREGRIKAGQRDDRIPELRQRLLVAGLLQPGDALVPELDRDILDKPLSSALKSFQKANAIKATGSLDKATAKVLGADPRVEQRNKIVVNMERIRWLPKDLGRRHILANQAGFEVVVRDSGKDIWHSKIIVGKPMTQTTVFSDTMETVVFNPSWGVPQSIIVNEYLPKLRRDPSYLDRQGFKVIDTDGSEVSSSSVDWWSYDNKAPLGVQQPPGGDNALGEIKFLFPNGHDIYMHDTPTRQLFDKSVRTFSHGCVRVQNPRDYASILLGWDRGKVDSFVESGETQSVPLPLPYKVHLSYFTAWPDADGKISYFTDVYGRDEKILGAISSLRTRQKSRVDLSLIADPVGDGKTTATD
jgi:L,D-transpeptidase YcbB